MSRTPTARDVPLLINGPYLECWARSCRKLNLNAILFVDSRGERSCCLETQQGFGLQFNLPARRYCICAETERASAGGSDCPAASSSCKRTDDRTGCSTAAGLSRSIRAAAFAVAGKVLGDDACCRFRLMSRFRS
jgi:hypothetical protein